MDVADITMSAIGHHVALVLICLRSTGACATLPRIRGRYLQVEVLVPFPSALENRNLTTSCTLQPQPDFRGQPCFDRAALSGRSPSARNHLRLMIALPIMMKC